MIAEEFKEVSEQDYKQLEDMFKDFLYDTQMEVSISPALGSVLDDFVVKVGIATKELLQKYGKQDHIQKLEVEGYRNQLQAMNKKMVKMNLQIKQVENSIQAYKNVSQS